MYAADLTSVFDELLQKHGGQPPPTRRVFDPSKTTNSFLQEAYRINGHITTLARQLADVRPAYLSTAPPSRRRRRPSQSKQHVVTTLTDAQREDVDANAKRLLRDLNAAIRALAEAESLHQETQRALVQKQFGLAAGAYRRLGLPPTAAQTAAEEGLKQAAAHRESVLWSLRQRLQACGRIQQTMMEARVARMVATPTALLPEMPPPPPANTGIPIVAENHDEPAPSTEDRAQAQLSSEQLQMFERDNQDMVQYYETTLDKVRAAEQSLVEISELQTMLVSNLEIQAAHVEQMVTDAATTEDNVAKGNSELKKALDRPSTARFTFYAAGGLCLFVVVWDFFV